MKKMTMRCAVAGLAVTLVGCGSTTADTVGLHYTGGPIEGERYESLIEPGSGQKFIGFGDYDVSEGVVDWDRFHPWGELARIDFTIGGADAQPAG